jgi:hypothetical protein
MKKIGVVVALVLVLAGSCATSPTIWDTSYLQEESADVLFYQMTVESYNEIGVNGWRYVRIPAGEANISADVYISHAGVPFLAQDMEFGCYLEAGKNYTIGGATRNGQWGVNVYEGAAPDNTKLLEFIPFRNQPDTFN